MQTTVRWVAVLLVLGMAGAAPVTDPGPARLASVEVTTTAQPPSAEITGAERTATSAVDGYWQRHFTEIFGRSYRAPRVAGGYTGTNGPDCGGQPAIPFNAFYCVPGDFLAWDENLMAAGYRQIGDSWVYLVIAHEWGHAIQARLRRGLVGRSPELQADCLAGASLQGAVRDRLVSISPGDDEELGRTLAAAADDYPWTNERDHGNAQERLAAFNTGAQRGVAGCF